MKQLPPVLFIIGYFFGGWWVCWILVMVLECADPKFRHDVGLYYMAWTLAYLPVAIMGVLALIQMSDGFRMRLLAALCSLVVVLLAMFISFYLDVQSKTLYIEYITFAFGFWLLARYKKYAKKECC
ncbi:MAG: hypothetical protein AB7E49_10360 [Campylobacterales bacterium]